LDLGNKAWVHPHHLVAGIAVELARAVALGAESSTRDFAAARENTTYRHHNTNATHRHHPGFVAYITYMNDINVYQDPDEGT